jgi:hypothetical protein
MAISFAVISDPIGRKGWRATSRQTSYNRSGYYSGSNPFFAGQPRCRSSSWRWPIRPLAGLRQAASAPSSPTFDHEDHSYICPADKRPCQRQKVCREDRSFVDENGVLRYRTSNLDCGACALKPRCCPTQPARKILRSVHEGARDLARDIATTDAYLVSRRHRSKPPQNGQADPGARRSIPQIS